MAENKQIKIKLKRGLIGASEAQRRVVRGLGLTKKIKLLSTSTHLLLWVWLTRYHTF